MPARRSRQGLPQLAGYSTIKVGSAGIFGSRSVKATFDATGAPLTLSYSVDAAGELVTTLHNAELTRLNEKTALEEARTKLREAEAANKPAPALAPPAS